MITLFLICTYFYFRKISKVKTIYTLFLYNRNFDDSIVKVNPLFKKLIKKLPRTWLFYKLYFVFARFICATKKQAVLTGEMLPIKDMRKFKKLIDNNYKNPAVTLYKCFKTVAIFITGEDVELDRKMQIFNLKKSTIEFNNKIDDDDFIIFEFKKTEIYKLLKEKDEIDERINPDDILTTLYPIIENDLNSKDLFIYSVIFVEQNDEVLN